MECLVQMGLCAWLGGPMEDQNHLGTTLVDPHDSCYWWSIFLAQFIGLLLGGCW